MTPPNASLSRLLALVEQWSAVRCSSRTDAEFMTEYYRLNDALRDFDIPALRLAAQQHAEVLRRAVGQMPANAHFISVTGYNPLQEVLLTANWLDPKEEA